MSDPLSETTKKSTNILQNTVGAFKGKGKTEDLIEDFTSEVALVTEGLWTDLRSIEKQMNHIQMEQTLWENKEKEKYKAVEEKIQGLQKEVDQLAAQMTEKNKKKKQLGTLELVSRMVFVFAGAWVLVTLIKAFFM